MNQVTYEQLVEWAIRFQREQECRATKSLLRSLGGTLFLVNLLLNLTIIPPGPWQYAQIVLGLAMLLGSLFVRVH